MNGWIFSILPMFIWRGSFFLTHSQVVVRLGCLEDLGGWLGVRWGGGGRVRWVGVAWSGGVRVG